MMDRIEVFYCKKLPNHKPGVELIYRKNAMEIIHWMAEMTKGMPLWEDNDIRGEEMEVECEQPQYVPPVIDMSDVADVDESILSQSTVIRAHLDVYDETADTQVLPYRLTSAEFNLDSVRYHESVYLNIQGKYKEKIDTNRGYDLQLLFQSRRQVGWMGVDSLYHAWLLVNHRVCPPQFSIKKFDERYPDWRSVIMNEMDLTPIDIKAENDLTSEPKLFNPRKYIENVIVVESEEEDDSSEATKIDDGCNNKESQPEENNVEKDDMSKTNQGDDEKATLLSMLKGYSVSRYVYFH